MALIFDAPVPADGVGDGGGVGGETAEEEGDFGGFVAVSEMPGAIDAYKCLEFRPRVFFKKKGKVRRDPATARFQTSVVFLNLLKVWGARGGNVVQDCGDDTLHRILDAYQQEVKFLSEILETEYVPGTCL